MASPLLAYANSRIRVNIADIVVRDADGRLTVNDTTYYLVVCYLKRTQYSGVTSGSRKIPLASELFGEMLPGAVLMNSIIEDTRCSTCLSLSMMTGLLWI